MPVFVRDLPATIFLIILDLVMRGKSTTGKTTAAINRLYEHLWIALGPRLGRNRAEALRALGKIRRTAEAAIIHKIVDPLEAGVAGPEASKRYKLYKEGESVADFILRHGDGGHVRLDVQRGCIALVKHRIKPRKSAKKAKKTGKAGR
jgi:hypothetical protein